MTSSPMKKKKTQQIPITIEKPMLKKASPANQIKMVSPVKETKLTKQFFLRVMNRQQKCKKALTQENIIELIHDYAKIIQYYNSRQDFIAIYFEQKMQNLMSSQGVINQFDKQKEIATTSMIEQQTFNPMQISEFKQISTPSKYDIETKKKERSKKVQIFMQIKKTKKRENAKNILNEYYQQCLQNNALVINELNLQRKDLQQRLKAIHKRSQNNAEALYGNIQNVNLPKRTEIYLS